MNDLSKDLSHIKGGQVLKVGDFIKHTFGWAKVVKVVSKYVYECVWVSDEEKEADPTDDRICAHTGEW